MHRTMKTLVSLADFEAEAARLLPGAAAAYLFGASADEVTLRANRAAFDAIPLVPRMARDLAGGSTAITLLGARYAAPVLAAPLAYQKLFHAEAEIGTAQACAAFGLGYCLSTLSSTPMETVRAAGEGAPQWFQLYAQPREADTLSLIHRAENAGFSALVITIDAPVNGIRNREMRAGFALPQGVRAVHLDGFAPPRPAPDDTAFDRLLAGAVTWASLEHLIRATRLPVLLKGLLHPDDARRALEIGAQGVIVSNHGGRTLDGAQAALGALPGIVGAVAGRAPVLLDSGVRRGTDVIKAMALGASAVLVGRPLVAALAVGGAQGAAQALKILMDEFAVAMVLSGCRTPADIGPELLATGFSP
jgi:4-hydroxymandelate oxidase